MTIRAKTCSVLLAFIGCAIFAVALFSNLWNPARRELNATRKELRAQGFKLEIEEFQPKLSADELRRFRAITNIGQKVLGAVSSCELPNLQKFVGSNCAQVVWQEAPESINDFWSLCRSNLSSIGPELMDEACRAASSGIVRSEGVIRPDKQLVLAHVNSFKSIASLFSTSTLLALHDNLTTCAWTNLFALTHLASAWRPEPSDISELTRLHLIEVASSTLWQALQTNAWTDRQLEVLQKEWETVDLLHGLPDTAGLARASESGMCQFIRSQKSGSRHWGQFLSQLLNSPRQAVESFISRAGSANRSGTSDIGAYRNEIAALLFFRDREIELRRAVNAQSWVVMRTLPGVTNVGGDAIPSAHSLLSRAVQGEASRQLVVTALALERFRLRTGTYPEHLGALVPALLARDPVDFMNGQFLHYQRVTNGQFTLYSVGLDGVDDGGTAFQTNLFHTLGFLGNTERIRWVTKDLIWPRPATQNEVSTFRLLTESNRLSSLSANNSGELGERFARRYGLKPSPLRTFVPTTNAAAPSQR